MRQIIGDRPGFVLLGFPRVKPSIDRGGKNPSGYPVRRNGHTSLAAIPNLLSETIPETGLGSQPVAANCALGVRFENIRLAAHGYNEEHRFLVAEQPREIGIQPREIVLEPVARNTAPTVAAAASILSTKHKDALMQMLPSYHIIEDEPMFRRAVKNAAEAAAYGALVTFGIEPTHPRPDTDILPPETVWELTKGVSRLIVSSKKPTS